MNKLCFDDIFSILSAASEAKPWMTSRTIAGRLGGVMSDKEVEQVLVKHCETSTANGEGPRVRYSTLPSRQTLEVLWGDLSKVGQRSVIGIKKQNVADDSLGSSVENQEPDLFISHSHRDYREVMKLARRLKSEGVMPWLAETHIGQDHHIHDSIILALKDTQGFLMYLSESALESKWTGKESVYWCQKPRPIPLIVIANLSHEPVDQLIRALQMTGEEREANLASFRSKNFPLVDTLFADSEVQVEFFAAMGDTLANAEAFGIRPFGELKAFLAAHGMPEEE